MSGAFVCFTTGDRLHTTPTSQAICFYLAHRHDHGDYLPWYSKDEIDDGSGGVDHVIVGETT